MRVDPEFKSLGGNPVLNELLEEDLVRDGGARKPVVVWGDLVISGGRRWEICKRLGLKYEVLKMEFESREDAMEWRLRDLLGKRHLSDHEQGELFQRWEALIRGHKEVTRADAREEIARAMNMSVRTVRRRQSTFSMFREMPKEWREAIEKKEVKLPATLYGTVRRAHTESPDKARLLLKDCLKTPKSATSIVKATIERRDDPRKRAKPTKETREIVLQTKNTMAVKEAVTPAERSRARTTNGLVKDVRRGMAQSQAAMQKLCKTLDIVHSDHMKNMERYLNLMDEQLAVLESDIVAGRV